MQIQRSLVNLNRAVLVNDSIQSITEVSREINIVAVNAILVAKRAGQQSVGFKVVAMELRMFSQHLEEIMARLGELIFRLVRRIAELLKQGRALRLFERTAALSHAHQDAVQACIQAHQHHYHSGCQQAANDWELLEKEVLRSLALCSSGAMLSHNARIEAAYGGSMLTDMQQVASRIEEIMERAIHSLKTLNHNLQDDEL